MSVGITACNRADHVAQADDFALARTCPTLKLVVVDDASDDGTSEMLAAYADPGIRLLRYPQRLGRAANCNWAIELAHGELIKFLDDDLLDANGVSEMAAAQDHPATGSRIGAMLSRQEVDRVARSELSDAEAEKMATELSKVLDHIEAVRSLDLEGAEPMSGVVDVFDALRSDVPRRSLDSEVVLAPAPEPTANGFGVPNSGASAE